jgi:hypothetical protein
LVRRLLPFLSRGDVLVSGEEVVAGGGGNLWGEGVEVDDEEGKKVEKGNRRRGKRMKKRRWRRGT